MSEFAFYEERAREAAALVAELEFALGRDPGNDALEINLASARSFFARAEEEFHEALYISQYDLVRYRLVQNDKSVFSLRDLSRSLLSFQDVVSYIYDSIVNGPRAGGRLPAGVKEDTTLGFGYSFAGSLGVVLTIPHDRKLFADNLDQVVPTLEDLLDVKDSDEVRDLARKIGRGTVQKVFEWSAANYQAGFDLDLRWTAPNVHDHGRYITNHTFGVLHEAIQETSEVEVETHKIRGILVGIDSNLRSFHFVEPSDDSIKGALDPGFPADRDWAINSRYDAEIQTETTVFLATGHEKIKHRLKVLSPIGGLQRAGQRYRARLTSKRTA